MSHVIPFAEDVFKPLCIKGNDTAEAPVEFELCAVGGAAKARLKSMIIATSGLADLGEWTEQVQRSVIAAFETGAPVFVEGVTAIRGLKVHAALALKAGILQAIPKGLDRKSEIPINNGYEFSRICGHWPILAFEVAMAISRLSGQADIDPRFFAWLSTSLVTQTNQDGTAERAAERPDGSATVASLTKPRASRRRRT